MLGACRGEFGTLSGLGACATPPIEGGCMAAPRALRWLAPFLVSAALIALAPSVEASSGPAVRGGGVVDGQPGMTSQLGFTATSSGGSFLCVMAGRSGGFQFASWQSIQQMQVQGRVTPGSLSITN